MYNQVKRPSRALWWLVVVLAVVLGFLSAVVTFGTIGYFERKEVILSDHNREQDRKLKAASEKLFEDNGVKVTFLGFNKTKSPFGNTIDFEVENKSSDDIKIRYDFLAINGIQVEAVMYESLSAGQKKQVSSTINTVLKDVKIDKIQDIEFGLVIDNGNDRNYYGEFAIKTNYYGQSNQMDAYAARKKILEQDVEDGKVVVSSLPALTQEKQGQTIFYLLIENESGSPISFMSDSFVINGKTIRDISFQTDQLRPGGKTVVEVEDNLSNNLRKEIGNQIDSFEVKATLKGHKENGSYKYEVENVSLIVK